MASLNGGMNRHFDSDQFPGRPRILFLGFPDNSHTHSWIDLLEGAQFNVRLFSISTGCPPDEWPVRTYITDYNSPVLNPATRARLYPRNSAARFLKRQAAQALGMPDVRALAESWLAKIIKDWQPHIIHTFGVEQSGEFYLRVRRKFALEGIGKWVLQTRGGSDLALAHLNPERKKQLSDVLQSCDQLVCDNEINFAIAREMGVREEQFASIAPVPGTGGLDVDSLAQKNSVPPSERRTIVCPKAFESPWGKILPVFEALKLCWNEIQPCEIHFLSMATESQMWFWSLPENIRRHCHPSEKIPRSQVIDLMLSARVMLAPSLVDGVPNSLYEAMATGAFPVVSPLDTILPLVKDGQNVLFARNLYPQEIAQTLTRAMTDDRLVDQAAERNLDLVRRVANRSTIRERVITFYEKLAGPSEG